jgi:hypothetical protein
LKEQIPQLEKQKRPVAFTCPCVGIKIHYVGYADD